MREKVRRLQAEVAWMRLDAKAKRSRKPNCTGEGTKPCGNVCRRPENCRDRVEGVRSEIEEIKSYAGKLERYPKDIQVELSQAAKGIKQHTVSGDAAALAAGRAQLRDVGKRIRKFDRSFIESVQPDPMPRRSKDPGIQKVIGKGSSATIYMTDEGTAYKKQRAEAVDEDIENEIAITAKAAKLGVSPGILSRANDGFELQYLKGYKPSSTYAKGIAGADPVRRSQVVRQMIKLHKAGIVHHDIHEGNALANSQNDVKIIDFGGATDIATLPSIDRLSPADEKGLQSLAAHITALNYELQDALAWAPDDVPNSHRTFSDRYRAASKRYEGDKHGFLKEMMPYYRELILEA